MDGLDETNQYGIKTAVEWITFFSLRPWEDRTVPKHIQCVHTPTSRKNLTIGIKKPISANNIPWPRYPRRSYAVLCRSALPSPGMVLLEHHRSKHSSAWKEGETSIHWLYAVHEGQDNSFGSRLVLSSSFLPCQILGGTQRDFECHMVTTGARDPEEGPIYVQDVQS